MLKIHLQSLSPHFSYSPSHNAVGINPNHRGLPSFTTIAVPEPERSRQFKFWPLAPQLATQLAIQLVMQPSAYQKSSYQLRDQAFRSHSPAYNRTASASAPTASLLSAQETGKKETHACLWLYQLKVLCSLSNVGRICASSSFSS